jgi:hypothetical protein
MTKKIKIKKKHFFLSLEINFEVRSQYCIHIIMIRNRELFKK